MSMFDVFAGKAKLVKNIVFLGGSGVVISLTLFVADKLKKEGVTDGSIDMIDPVPSFNRHVIAAYIWRYRQLFNQAKVQQLTYGKVKEITDTGMVADWMIEDRKTKTETGVQGPDRTGRHSYLDYTCSQQGVRLWLFQR